MKISEIFHSVQGESINCGKPSIFIRVTGCNMKPLCKWCDSKFALKGGKEYNITQLYNEIKKYPCDHIVFTGGEIYPYISPIKRFIAKYDDYTYEAETNGLIYFNTTPFQLVNVSPKIQNINEKALIRFDRLHNNVYFKFVIENKNNFNEWLGIIEELGLKQNHIIMMPEGTSPNVLKEKSSWLIELCKDCNFRFSTRLQILLWGNKKGT